MAAKPFAVASKALKPPLAELKVAITLIQSSVNFLKAARKGSVPNMTKALRLGADARAADLSARTALHWAVMGGHYEAVLYLCNLPGVDVNAPDKRGRTPLHAACAAASHANDLDAVQTISLLIGVGKAEINVQDENGETPLMWAAYYGWKEAVIYLLTLPGIADLVSATNKTGQTAEALAIEQNHAGVALLLRFVLQIAFIRHCRVGFLLRLRLRPKFQGYVSADEFVCFCILLYMSLVSCSFECYTSSNCLKELSQARSG